MQITITLQTANDYSNLIDAITQKTLKLQKSMEETKVCDGEESIAAWAKTNSELESLNNIVEQIKANV